MGKQPSSSSEIQFHRYFTIFKPDRTGGRVPCPKLFASFFAGRAKKEKKKISMKKKVCD
jgi:hypothetical protein